MTAEQLLKEAAAQGEWVSQQRRWLHAHPETGFDLNETLPYVEQQLIGLGYQPKRCGKAGLVALAGGKRPGKVFLIRADMDALPVKEESGEPFASDSGRMHACGHDMHTAMLLGAAKLLKEHEEEIEGTVKLMFQPAEEIFGGAHDMIEAGALEDPKVDAALMIHVTAGMPFTPGTVVVCDGGVSASAADYFTVRIQGKGCHGSTPHQGIDPITVAAHTVIALQEINARELSFNDSAALTVGTIQAGNAGNVIPDTAELCGTIRTFDEEVRATIKQRLEEICKGVAATFRASSEVSFWGGCPTLLNSAELSKAVSGYTAELLGPRMSFTVGQLSAMAGPNKKASKNGGSEDFAYVSQEVPSIMLALAAGQPDKGYCYPQHHPKVRFDEQALPGGSAVYAYTAMRWLQDNK